MLAASLQILLSTSHCKGNRKSINVHSLVRLVLKVLPQTWFEKPLSPLYEDCGITDILYSTETTDVICEVTGNIDILSGVFTETYLRGYPEVFTCRVYL